MAKSNDPNTVRETISQKLSEYLRETPPDKQTVAGFSSFLAKS